MAKPSDPQNTPETPKPDFRDRFKKRSSESLAGGIVANGRAGYQYTLVRPADYPNPLLKSAKEMRLAADGWAKCAGSEYSPDAADAEIWERSQSVCDQEWTADLADCVANKTWFGIYKECLRPWLPPEIASAMYDYHSDTLPPHNRPTLEQLRDVVFEFAKPHPGGSRYVPSWDKQAHKKDK